MVVAAEEREEVLRKIALVGVPERAHDAEVHRDVLAEMGAVGRDEDVAGVHVGVEVAVAEHLREEELDARPRQPLEVDAGLDQPVDLADRDPGHPFHDHDFAAAPVPVDLGHLQQRGIPEISAQLRAVGRLARKVELVRQRLLEFADDVARPETLAVGPQLLDQRRGGAQERDVLVDHLCDVRSQHLDRDLGAVGQLGKMHLRDRRARHRYAVERPEHLVDGLAVEAHERRDHGVRRERRHPVLQLGELVGDVERNQVATGRKHLPELDEDGPEILEREAQAHGPRCRRVAPERQRVRDRPHRAKPFVAGQELVEPVLQHDADNHRESQQAHATDCKGSPQTVPAPMLAWSPETARSNCAAPSAGDGAGTGDAAGTRHATVPA